MSFDDFVKNIIYKDYIIGFNKKIFNIITIQMIKRDKYWHIT